MGTSDGAMIAFGALAGGIGAQLTGGNFWQGAVIGAVVAGLNHQLHKGDGPGPKAKRPTYKKEYSFSKTQGAYGLSEGLGVFATYSIEGRIVIEGNSITVTAFGSTEASSQNSVYFSGEVTVRGTSEYTLSSYNKTIQLQRDYSRANIWNLDKPYIGKATFEIPSNVKNFNISVKAGYVFRNSDNLFSIPIPATTTYSQGFKK